MIKNFEELRELKKSVKNMNFEERQQFYTDLILFLERNNILTYEKYVEITDYNDYIEDDIFEKLQSSTQKMIMKEWEKEQAEIERQQNKYNYYSMLID